jgi:lambda family phage tail tape measure protein
MANDSKTLELQIRIAAQEAFKAVSFLKGEISSLAAEVKKFSDSDGQAIAETFRQTQAAAEKAAASMKLFGSSSTELRQVQAQLKNAAVELVTKGIDPQSEEVKKLIEEYKRLGKEAADLDKANGKNIQSFGDLQNTMIRLAEVAALAKVLSVIKDLGAFALQTADNFQTARNQFGVLLGDMEAGAGLFNEIKAFNDKTPFDLTTLTQATNVLISAKVPLRDLQAQLTKFGDLSQGNSQKLTSYINAFSQAAAKGKADMQVLNTYLHQGVPILDELAKNFGVTTAEIIMMSGEGKISFEEFSRALDDLTAAGGQYFGGMELGSKSLAAMQEGLKEATNSLAASFGGMLLPAAVAVLDALTAIANAINESPILKGMFTGAIVALTGYLAAMAVKAGIAFAAQMSLNFAVGALNPVVLATTIAVAGLAAGYTVYAARQQTAARETENAALQQMKQKDAIDATREAVTSFNNALKDMTDENISRQIQFINIDIIETERSIRELTSRLNEYVQIRNFDRARQIQELIASERQNLEAARENLLSAQNTLTKRRTQWIDSMFGNTQAAKIQKVNEQLAAANGYLAGKNISDTDRTKLQEIIRGLNDELQRLTNNSEGAKKWQEWFGEITKIDPALIGNSGARAAELYLAEFGRGLAAQKTVAETLGEQLDFSGVLKSRRAEIQNALTELFSIDPELINEPFTAADESVRLLVEEYRRLGVEIKATENAAKTVTAEKEYAQAIADITKKIDDLGKSERQLAYEAELARIGLDAQSDEAVELAHAMDRLSVASALSDLGREVRNLGKDQYDLALATMAAANATEEEMKQAQEMIETLRRYGQSIEELLSRKIAAGFANLFSELEEQATETIGNIAAQLAMISFDSILDGFAVLSEAFAKGERAAESLRQALADTAQQILDQLPGMYLQAGLQLIAQGQWALGLGLVAAAGSSAIVGGYVKGTIEKEKATVNAHGNAFDSNGIIPHAHGGSFTNQIIGTPTYFRYGGNFGVMGEAGPESIMPLRRMSNGDLGVAASGCGGANVIVNVINNSGAEVQKEERTDAEGNKQIDVIIGQLVNNHITSGKADRAMSRYGIRARGV